MSEKRNTKDEIVAAFIGKVENGSVRDVHVAKLIKELGINRNTFYHHFDNKYDVALYAFRLDLAARLRESFPEEELVWKPLDDKRNSESAPYYVHREVGAHLLDFGGFYKALVCCVLDRTAFYNALFDYTQSEFRACIEDLYRPAVAEDMKFVLGGRYLPGAVFDYFVDFYTRYIFQIAEYYLKHTGIAHEMLNGKVNPFWNMPYEALSYALQTHTVQRSHSNQGPQPRREQAKSHYAPYARHTAPFGYE